MFKSFKTLNKEFGKAVHQYDMIQDGDRIAVGLSGGFDSLTLLWLLKERLERILIHYEIYPVFIDPGFDDGFTDILIDFCRMWGFDLRVDYTEHGILAHSDENLENPCFLCSRLRRKRLFEIADELNCSKLALGHNKDDIIETLFLNICYAGQICTMMPSQSLFQDKITIIRPLAFSDSDVIRKFAGEKEFPVFTNPCPTSKTSKRKEVKVMLNQLYKGNHNIKGNIFRSLSHVKADYLLKKNQTAKKKKAGGHESSESLERGSFICASL